MQIEIYTPTQGQPLPSVEWNYPEVKKWLEDGLESYKGRVYTEATINEAKKDRANLNKLADAIDTKRKEMKATYLKPYEEFEAQAKELTAMVKEQSAEIDKQVKAFEELRKQEKLATIKESYSSMAGDLAKLVPYERLHNSKWLNVTVSMAAIAGEMGRAIDRIEAGLSSIDKLGLADDIAERIKDVFLKDFDLAAALAEKERIEKQREELARYKAAQEAKQEPPRVIDASDPDAFAKARPGDIVRFGGPDCETAEPAEPIYTVVFKVEATKTQLNALKAFLNNNGIKYGRA